MTKSRGIRSPRQIWTDGQVETLVRLYATSDAGLIMIDRLRFAGTVLIVAVCALMTVTAITRVFS